MVLFASTSEWTKLKEYLVIAFVNSKNVFFVFEREAKNCKRWFQNRSYSFYYQESAHQRTINFTHSNLLVFMPKKQMGK